MTQETRAVFREILSPQALEHETPYRTQRNLPDALAQDLAAIGFERESLLTDARIDVSGRYTLTPRPWDVAILDDGLPVVVVEIKINSRSSLGKNVHNRINDFVAAATNVARTFDGPDRAPFKPGVAALLVTGWGPSSSRFVSEADPTPHIKRAGLALSNMLEDGLLAAACLLHVDHEEMRIHEPYSRLSFEAFTSAIRASAAATIQRRQSAAVSAVDLGRVLARGGDIREVVSGITSTSEGLSAAEAAVIRERRRVVASLQQLAVDPSVNETKMHRAIGAQYWLFGGQYVGVADRRAIVPLDQYDIPLVCADGSLEIVELKGPEVKLVKEHRGHKIVTGHVHEAVSQCLNYLSALDDLGAALTSHYRTETKATFDLRRAKGTVIIGHPDTSTCGDIDRETIDHVIRSYNSHLSRLRVLTYADLLESADRALDFISSELD